MNLNSMNIKAALGVMIVCIVGLCASPAQAATITVTASALDVLNGANGSCSLREAIQNMNDAATTYADCANTGAAYGTSDTINIPAGTYTTTIATTNENLNANGDFDINRSVAIVGAGASSTFINGGALDRVFHITGVYTVSISGVTIQNGNMGGNAGGIYNQGGTLTVTNSTISGNTTTNNGGGISNTGTLTVTNSTISGNSATFGGVGGGGGIFNASIATITNTTFSGNTTNGWGGGILNGGTLTVTNSTISGNTAATNIGGGILSNSAVTVINSTITNNSGAGIFRNAGSATISNSIIANQAADWDCSGGGFISNGHNLDSDGSCGLVGAGDISNSAAANLGALASNGGLTQTHALLTGSAAMDAGDNTICAAAPVSNASQNGITRPSDGDGNGTATCDIGAYEAPDTTPDAFSFTAQTGVALSSVATSNTITVAGINTASPISISAGGSYSINSGGYISGAGTVSNNDTVTVQQTSSGSYSTPTTATLTIGGVSGAFNVTTLAAPTSYTGATATGTGNATATASGGGATCGFTVAQFVSAANPPAGVTFPHGLFDFTLNNCTPGSTITVSITWPSALPAGTQYWKYGPTPTNSTPHWYVLPATIAGNVTTFSITDGGLGDDDLAANGTIVDQGGPGVPGGGASGIPTLSEWGLILLAGMLGMYGMVGVRRGNADC